MTLLERLVADAMAAGWASATGSISALLTEATALGWTPSPIRRGEAALGTLSVVTKAEAHAKSLSAMVGHGQQPLHTDGAHHSRMPDLVLLSAVDPSPTPTLLCRPGPPTEAQRQGVFKVGGGPRAFYASAIDAAGRWRYDPGCMAPADEFAAQAALEIESLAAQATAFQWRHSSTVLAIANRHALHARAAAKDPDSRRMHRVALISDWSQDGDSHVR